MLKKIFLVLFGFLLLINLVNAETITFNSRLNFETKLVGSLNISTKPLSNVIAPTISTQYYFVKFADINQKIKATNLNITSFKLVNQTLFAFRIYNITKTFYNHTSIEIINETFNKTINEMGYEWKGTQQTSFSNSNNLEWIIAIDVVPFRKGLFNLSMSNLNIDPDITACGDLTTANGVYTVTSNIVWDNTRLICLDILADNITLNMNGKKLSGNTSAISSMYGIRLFSINGTIANGTLNNIPNGIKLSKANNTIYNNTFYTIGLGVTYPIQIYVLGTTSGTLGSNITNNFFNINESSTTGIYFINNALQNVNVSQNIFNLSASAGNGVQSGSGRAIIDNNIFLLLDSNPAGIVSAGNFSIINNYISASSTYTGNPISVGSSTQNTFIDDNTIRINGTGVGSIAINIADTKNISLSRNNISSLGAGLVITNGGNITLINNTVNAGNSFAIRIGTTNGNAGYSNSTVFAYGGNYTCKTCTSAILLNQSSEINLYNVTYNRNKILIGQGEYAWSVNNYTVYYYTYLTTKYDNGTFIPTAWINITNSTNIMFQQNITDVNGNITNVLILEIKNISNSTGSFQYNATPHNFTMLNYNDNSTKGFEYIAISNGDNSYNMPVIIKVITAASPYVNPTSKTKTYDYSTYTLSTNAYGNSKDTGTVSGAGDGNVDFDDPIAPTWPNGWQTATNFTANGYANIVSSDLKYANISSGKSNGEPFARYNITVKPGTSINWMNVSIDQALGAGAGGVEVCWFAIGNYTNQGWMNISFPSPAGVAGVTTNLMQTRNFTTNSDIQKFVGPNNVVTLLSWGSSLDTASGDYCKVDKVFIIINYNLSTTYTSIQKNESNLYPNRPYNFSAIATTNDDAISGFIFSSNFSGVWINSSFVSSGTTNSEYLSNITYVGLAGNYAWQIYSNTTDNYWTTTSIQYATVSSPPANSCTAPPINNDWVISAADFCNITASSNIGSGKLLIWGQGRVTFSAGASVIFAGLKLGYNNTPGQLTTVVISGAGTKWICKK